MICMYCNVLLPVRILVPFVHTCDDFETFLFDLRIMFFSVTQSVRGKTYKQILLEENFTNSIFQSIYLQCYWKGGIIIAKCSRFRD